MFIYCKAFIAVVLTVQINACNNTYIFHTANITCSVPSILQSQQCKHNFNSCTISSINFTQIFNDKAFCLHTCCTNSTPPCPPTSTPTLLDTTPSLHILISVISVLAFLAISIILCYRYNEYTAILKDKCCCCCCKHSEVANLPSIPHRYSTELSLNQIAIKGWKEDQIGLGTAECPVCLCDYPNLMTDCGHSYHILCLRQCLIRKFQCVLCRNSDIETVKIYCTKCLHYYTENHILDFYSPNMNKVICKICNDNIQFQQQPQ